MKFLVLLAIVGAALADSDAGYLYGGYGGYAGIGGYAGYGGYGLGYAGHGYGYPLRTGVFPATVGGGLVAHANGAVVPADEPAVQAARAAHLSAKAHTYGGYGHGIWKREADAEADAGYLYGGAYAGHGYAGLGYAGYGGYAGLGYAGQGYAGLGYAGHGYGHGYPLRTGVLPATVGGGLVAHANGAVVPADEPAVQAARAAHLTAKAHTFGGYGHGIWKREAEADAGYLYGGAYAGHGYAGLGYAGYGGYGYHGVQASAFPAGLGPHGLVPASASGGLVPAEEPANVAARAEHLAIAGNAYAHQYGGYAGYGYGRYGLW